MRNGTYSFSIRTHRVHDGRYPHQAATERNAYEACNRYGLSYGGGTGTVLRTSQAVILFFPEWHERSFCPTGFLTAGRVLMRSPRCREREALVASPVFVSSLYICEFDSCLLLLRPCLLIVPLLFLRARWKWECWKSPCWKSPHEQVYFIMANGIPTA